MTAQSIAGLLAFATSGLASDFSSSGPLTPESEAARREITFQSVTPPPPDPFPIESFGDYGRVNVQELARREHQNPDAFKRGPFVAPNPPLSEFAPRTTAQQTQTSIAKKSFRLLSHDSTSSTPPPPASINFLALLDNLTGIPPDTHGAVGPNHVMTSLNGQIRFQNRVGEQLSVISLLNFWSGITNPVVTNAFDPRTLYDPYSDRWISVAVTADHTANSAVLLSVSQTTDPTGNWWQFRVDADSADNKWADFPSVGFNKDWIVVSVNMFGNQDDLFKEQHIYVFNKANKYSGGTNAPTLFVDASASTTVPAVTRDNALATLYLVTQLAGSPAGQLRISTITGPVGSETYTPNSFFSTPGIEWGVGITNDFAPQLNSTRKIQNGSSRMQRVEYQVGYLWFAHTVFFPATGTPTRSAVQWWQLNTNQTVIDHGLIQDTNGVSFYAFPSIAVNSHGDALIGYSRFAASQYASANYAFRFANDPAGTLRHDTVLKAGEAKYDKDLGSGQNRWGDYSATVVDPVNNTWMWTIQEYAATPSGPPDNKDRWSTWWAQIMSTPNGDFARDGSPDILWRYQGGNGTNALWYMQGTNLATTVGVTAEPDLNWQIAGTLDPNRDGDTDILWRNYSTGANRVWYMTGAGQTLSSNATLTAVTDPLWKMTGTGDFDYDGQRDILWHNRSSTTGDIAIWLMNGTIIRDTAILPQKVTDLNWNIGGSGDFNKDNKTDILWYNSGTGENAIWIMNGTNFVTSVSLPTNSDVNWAMVAAGDYNGDGQMDIVWRHQVSGQNVIWIMDPATNPVTNILSIVTLSTETNTIWKIVGPK